MASAAIPFIPAVNFKPGRVSPVDLIVLHSTESDIQPGAARSVAAYFGGPGAPEASSHYIVDADQVIQAVLEGDTAWAAPGANNNGIQIEQVGRAATTNWLGEGMPVFDRSARLVADIAKRYNIPIERVDAAGLRAGKRGLTTHATVDEVFHLSSHVDPGLQGDVRWPWTEYLALVKKYRGIDWLPWALAFAAGTAVGYGAFKLSGWK